MMVFGHDRHDSERLSGFDKSLLYVCDGEVTKIGLLDVHDTLDHEAQICPHSGVCVSRHS